MNDSEIMIIETETNEEGGVTGLTLRLADNSVFYLGTQTCSHGLALDVVVQANGQLVVLPQDKNSALIISQRDWQVRR